jgi:phosphoglycolate phosphatase-like HAD superfamily hydrolase
MQVSRVQLDLAQYKTLVFDCDGVILDSNLLKTQAYYDTAIAFGASHEQAQAIVDYHVRLGGISRYPKFEYFLHEILHRPVTAESMTYLLDRFASEIHHGLLHCKLADGLFELRERYPQQRWMVLSGGDQAELRELFKQRGLDNIFDGGIFGSPDNKDQVLAREIASGHLTKSALFLGDSKYDHEAASRAGLDFLFLSEWTEFEGWQAYCEQHHIRIYINLGSLL